MCHAFHVNRKTILLAHVIELSKISNMSIALVRGLDTFADMIQSQLIFARVSRENYGIRIADVRVLVAVEDLLSSNFQAVNFRPTLIRYTTIGEVIMESRSELPMLGKL